MEEKENKIFGLLGKNISYSFSRGYFANKFQQECLANYKYENFDLKAIEEVKTVFTQKNIKGLNVTIPYKQEVIPFLDSLDVTAKDIGAVNTIKFFKDGVVKGYNSDVVGFENSLKPLLQNHHHTALILGTGGASKAIAYVLSKNGINFKYVSRRPKNEQEISYSSLTKQHILDAKLIINCTPIGTFPNIEDCPNIPYKYINNQHLLYDLIYNPEESTFLTKGKENGAVIKNGLEMLQLQAEESWRIWNL